MSNNLMYKLVVEGEGFCCIWAYMRAKRRFNTSHIASHLGVDARSVRRWKNAIRHYACKCDDCSNCMRRDVEQADSMLASRPGDEFILRTPKKRSE